MELLKTLLNKLPKPRGDKYIWAMTIILLSISMIEVASASSRLTFGKASYLNPILSHFVHLCMGVGVIYVVHLIHYKKYKIVPVILVPLSIGLLLFLTVQGMHSQNAERWIDLKFIQLQPSELAKLSVVMAVAFWLSKLKRDDELSQVQTFWKITVLTGVVCLLIFGENLSTAILLGAVVFFMMIIGGVAWKRLLILVAGISSAGIVFVVICLLVPPQTVRDSKILPARAVTWQARILDFHDDDKGDGSARDYVRYIAPEKPQETHAKIAIATSNVIGKMPGNSKERDYLSEATSDFIFAIIIEELGMIGGIAVVAVYLFLLFRIGRISARCRKKYPAYLAIGLGMMLGFQAFVNMLVAVGAIPVTGQPLPLISKGGTSILVTSVCIGMLLGISGSLDEEEAQAMAQEQELPAPLQENATFDKTI